VENLKERESLGDLDVDSNIISKLIVKKWGVMTWIGIICISVGSSDGFF
jgi:hypothetical protein